MPTDFWAKLWDSGVPVVLLFMWGALLWRTWRLDTDKASKERIANGILIQELSNNIKDLKDELSGFFLTHFP